MKQFLLGCAAFLLALLFYSFQHDLNLNQQYLKDLKEVCVEASAAAALFVERSEYGQGRVVFNREEGEKAIRAVIKVMLDLDDSLYPLYGSYWQERIAYRIYFLDDSNTVYPLVFVDPETGYSEVIRKPTVVVTVSAGRAWYSLDFLKNQGGINRRSASHAWEAYN